MTMQLLSIWQIDLMTISLTGPEHVPSLCHARSAEATRGARHAAHDKHQPACRNHLLSCLCNMTATRCCHQWCAPTRAHRVCHPRLCTSVDSRTPPCEQYSTTVLSDPCRTSRTSACTERPHRQHGDRLFWSALRPRHTHWLAANSRSRLPAFCNQADWLPAGCLS